MPVNAATAAAMSPRVLAGFSTYLGRVAAGHPMFHVLGPLLVVWPDRYFGDALGHLNPRGAALFSDWFAGCLAARMAGATACQPIAPDILLAARGG
jgi:hypothetical protein